MNTGVIIICRYSSSRLPGKILMPIHGKPVLQHIISRARAGCGNRPVAVATSDQPSDDLIEAFCNTIGIQCYRGSLDDVAGRFLAAAKMLRVEFAVRINGDNVLVNSEALEQMIQIAETGLYDLVTNVPGRTFPYGMSIEVIRIQLYSEIYKTMTNPVHREHVTSFLYENSAIGKRFLYQNASCPEAIGLKLAMDTKEDMDFLTQIMGMIPADAKMPDIARSAHIISGSYPWRGRHGPLLIAEIGGNHEGDFEAARRMTSLAIDCGVDFVKFQLYRGDTLVSPIEARDRNLHFKKFELSKEQHLKLAQMCRDGGIGYMASVWDLSFLEWIDEWMPIYKIGSGDLTARPIVREFARRGKPMIVATGVSTLAEVLSEVAFIQSVNPIYNSDRMLALLQCTSMYPIPDSDANLAVMETLRSATGLTVGYSSHTEGRFPLIVAAAMGAKVLEFHFTDRREGQAFRDHKVSLMPDEVRALQNDLDRLVALRGDGIKRLQQSEISSGHVTSFRRATYPAKDIPSGSIIKASDLICLRPNHGIDARENDYVVGKIAAHKLLAFKQIDKNALI